MTWLWPDCDLTVKAMGEARAWRTHEHSWISGKPMFPKTEKNKGSGHKVKLNLVSSLSESGWQKTQIQIQMIPRRGTHGLCTTRKGKWKRYLNCACGCNKDNSVQTAKRFGTLQKYCSLGKSKNVPNNRNRNSVPNIFSPTELDSRRKKVGSKKCDFEKNS